MRRASALGVALAAITLLIAVGATSASAALPEVGRCVKTEGTKEGKKTIYSAKYQNKKCTVESAGGNTGKYEWSEVAEKEIETIAFMAGMTFETEGGRTISCNNHIAFGAFTGPKTESWTFSLRNCEDSGTKTPCQSFLPEKQLNETGRIDSEELVGELGYINKAGKNGKPEIGWEFKPKTGNILFFFECGTTPLTGTKVTVEGSFIGQIKKVNKMLEEAHSYYRGAGGKQIPESFEGGAPATMTATFLQGLEAKTEKVALIEPTKFEEDIYEEEIEFKA
jgi:hypothetical protein